METMEQDYRMQHQPDATGAPLHDVESVMPDYYEHPEWYRTGDDESDGMSERAILRAKGDPDRMTWVWRAVPREVFEADGPSIRPGDWVTTSKPYAKQHAAQGDDPAHDWPVASRWVPARELTQDGNSINEWGWFPGGES